jgi:HEAT repeat protein
LANHGTQENVPVLIKCLASTTDQNVRSSIIRGLGRLKDKRAVQPLADVLAMGPADQLQFNSSRNTDAAAALERMGPEAESAVLGLLKEKNSTTRWQACQILKHIGTSKSIPALKDLMLAPSRELSEAAADACRAIEAREGK